MSTPQQAASAALSRVYAEQGASAAIILEAGRALALEARDNPIKDGLPYVILRDADGRERIEYLDPANIETAPARKIATVKMHDAEAFVAYCNVHKVSEQSFVYAMPKPAQFLAIFDDHGKEPGFRDHKATYAVEHSDEWNDWISRNGKPFDGNTDFAEWLETRLVDITDPAGARLMEMVMNLKFSTNGAFESFQNIANGSVNFRYINTVTGNTSAGGGEVSVPERFRLEIPVFKAREPKKYTVDARFRTRLDGSRLKVWYELDRPAKVVETAFNDMLKDMQTKLGTAILFGSPA